jgi:hypothetical protein
MSRAGGGGRNCRNGCVQVARLTADRHDEEPPAIHTAIRIANDLNADEIAGSAVARNTFILLRQAIERGGLHLTATGNLSRAVVAEMRNFIEWPDFKQADAFRLHKVINEAISCHCISFKRSQKRPFSCEQSAASWWQLLLVFKPPAGRRGEDYTLPTSLGLPES